VAVRGLGLIMENQVFRDPTAKDREAWRVLWYGQVCLPEFNSRGAAIAYLVMLKSGRRRPELREAD
jgi:hypothetical protein